MIDLSGYQLIIFDKDGTLIDFDAMWGGWVEQLAARLEAATGRALAPAVFDALGYDAAAHRTLAGGPLAVISMSQLFDLTGHCLGEQGVSQPEAASILGRAWFTPDPAVTARPLVNLPRLFGALRARGLKIAIATSDDHAPTLATLASLNVAHLVDALIAADDNVAPKPAADMILAACRATGVAPSQAIMVGDGLPDMDMARAAGAGLRVGVTSGVSAAWQLAPHVDLLLSTVNELLD